MASSIASLASGANFFAAVLVAAALDPNASAAATQAIIAPLVGALLAPLLFAICLAACTRASAQLALGCCALSAPPRADATAPWRAGAAAAKWRFAGASYCYAQGLALLAAAFGMPWMSFSAALTLPLLASSGLLVCDAAAVLPPLQPLCTGGTLMTAGSALFYAAIALGLAAWGVAWALAIRARNLAHHGTLPASACCGTLPAALYLGAASTLLALAGVVVAWMGYNSFVSLVPAAVAASLKLGAPPGGLAAIFGLLSLCAGNGLLWWAHAALPAGRPVPFMTGRGLLSPCPAEGAPEAAAAAARKRINPLPSASGAAGEEEEAEAAAARAHFWAAQAAASQRAAAPPPPSPFPPAAPAAPPLAELHSEVREREVRLAARFLLEREDALPPGWRCVAAAGRTPQHFRAPTGALHTADPRDDASGYVEHVLAAWRGGWDVLARVPEDLGARATAHAGALLRAGALPPRWTYARGEFVAPCGTPGPADPRLSPPAMEEEVAAALGARAL